jgi:putative ABC transport system permease protein
MVWAIAIRNLWQHKTKTLIIGILITIGITFSFAGNAFIDSVIKNISGIFTDYYTGDILITSTETLGAGVFGAQSDDVMGFPTIPVLKDYDKTMEIVNGLKGVKSVTHQLSGYGMFGTIDENMDYACFFGVEPDSYFETMPYVEILDGRMLENGEEGMLLHQNMQKKLKEKQGKDYKVGDMIQINNFGTGGLKIKEVPIVGIFKYPRGNERMFNTSFLDARSLRYLLGSNAGKQETVVVAKEATELLDSDLDSLFSGESFGDTDAAGLNGTTGTLTNDNLYSFLGERKAPPAEDQANLSWHFILIRSEKGVNADKLIKQLNDAFDENDMLVRAQGWWVSAMPDSLTYSGLKLLFNVAIFILGFVSIIIIMNTLVVSVMERTSEIGTMRALGARKSFVRKMFIAETVSVTAAFGLLGMAIGAAVIFALGKAGIPTDNDALRYLGGGGILRPVIGAQPVILSLSFMALIALTSWIYPVIIALKISPLKAITTE